MMMRIYSSVEKDEPMPIELDLSDDAPWKKRYRAPAIAFSSRASQNPKRACFCSNKDGVYQLYAWAIETGALTRLTDQPAGVVAGNISADGEYVYYLKDSGGDEIGHYVRLPFTGGTAEDITPDLPAYASHFLSESHSGNSLGFTSANKDGFQILLYDRLPGKTPTFSYQTSALSTGPFLSHNAEIAIIASAEKTGVAEFALSAFEVKSGELIAELWDGAGTGVQPAEFSPRPGDMRFAGSSNATVRPFIWNPHTGQRQDLLSHLFRGDVTVWAWSPDGARLLLHQVHQALHTLYVYDIANDNAILLNTPAGSSAAGYFVENGNIYLHWNDAANPPSLIEIDGTTGARD